MNGWMNEWCKQETTFPMERYQCQNTGDIKNVILKAILTFCRRYKYYSAGQKGFYSEGLAATCGAKEAAIVKVITF